MSAAGARSTSDSQRAVLWWRCMCWSQAKSRVPEWRSHSRGLASMLDLSPQSFGRHAASDSASSSVWPSRSRCSSCSSGSGWRCSAAGDLAVSLVVSTVRTVHGVMSYVVLVEGIEPGLRDAAVPAAVRPPAGWARRPRADLARPPGAVDAHIDVGRSPGG
jgi:hypothetical protein